MRSNPSSAMKLSFPTSKKPGISYCDFDSQYSKICVFSNEIPQNQGTTQWLRNMWCHSSGWKFQAKSAGIAEHDKRERWHCGFQDISRSWSMQNLSSLQSFHLVKDTLERLRYKNRTSVLVLTSTTRPSLHRASIQINLGNILPYNTLHFWKVLVTVLYRLMVLMLLLLPGKKLVYTSIAPSQSAS